MRNKFADRIDSLRVFMRKRGWDALLISGSDSHCSEYVAPRWHQVEWLCGFSGEGDIVLTLDHAGLWTDTRYFIQACKQLHGTGVELHKTRVPDEVLIPQWLSCAFSGFAKSCTVIAVDGLSTAKTEVDAIVAAFEQKGVSAEGDEPGLRIVNYPNLLDAFWEDRPSVPQTPIITLGSNLVGEDRSDKLLWLRNFLKGKGCDSMLLTALDEIAWLLNIRGSDVEYNPVSISYLLVTLEGAKWFVRKSLSQDSETTASFGELKAEGVDVLPYDGLELEIARIAADAHDGLNTRLYVDPSTLNHHISILLGSIPGGVIYGPSPIPLRKAVKNEVELEGMREAHLEDGLVMERFLYWIDMQMEMDNPVSEWDASQKLHSLRASVPGFRGESFETISAYGENAALPHYVTPHSGSARLEPHGLYLVDSGGQYLFGTTDITRTIPLGPCTRLEQEDYTLVLRGHINLSRAVFPKGTAGCQLDALARNPLWECKRNFGHGTGHGVGFFLNVHEGPQDIRQNFNSVPLLPGMITSNEPGIYREGKHGVRHENLILCKEAGSNDFGSWLCFENLTLCHIDTSAVLTDLMNKKEVEWLNAYNAHVYETLKKRLPKEIAAWLKTKTAPISL